MKKHYYYTTFLFFFLLLTKNTAFCQKKAVAYGTITDKETGERLIGANVISRATKQGTFSSALGTYNLSIKAEGDTLEVSYIGFKPLKIYVNAQKEVQLTLQLIPSVELGAVTIESQRFNNDRVGVVQLSMKTLKSLPSLGGEADPMKGLQYLPGVKAGSEGSAGIYVRGGTPDQNLILLDGVPVYNSAHLFGFVSTFNPSVIQSLELTKGGFPARYGGRLASVIDVRTRNGNSNKNKNEVKIGLISSHIQSEGPLKKEKASYLISLRRSLYEAYFLPQRLFKEGSEATNYYLMDLNVKIHYTASPKDNLSFSVYGSKDKYKSIESNTPNKYSEVGIYWENFIASLRWERNWNKNLFSNFVFYKNNYNFSVYSHSSSKRFGASGAKDTINSYNVDYDSKIKDWGANWIFYYNPNNKHNIKFGVNAITHRFAPGVTAIAATFEDSITIPSIKQVKNIDALEARAFVEDSWKINKYLQFNFGVHSSIFNVQQRSYTSLEPRLSTVLMPTNNFNIKASYTTMQQYLHLLTNSGLGSPTDLWVPPTAKVAPQYAQQWSLGTFYRPNDNFAITLEAYQKKMRGLIDYKEGASFLIQADDWENKVATNGTGDARGIELLVEHNSSKLNAWFSYTLAKTTRQFATINQGQTFPYKYDRRHEISLVGVYEITKKWEFSTSFVYATGNALTLPRSVYVTSAYPVQNFSGGANLNQPIINLNIRDNNYSIPQVAVFDYGGKNSSRMPDYHRLDIGFNRHVEKNRGDATLNFSIYNVYARRNPYYVRYKFANTFDPKSNNGSFQVVSIFQFVPAVSWLRRF